VLNNFLKLLEARGLTEQSIKRYMQFARKWINFSKGKWDKETVRIFLAELKEKGFSGTYQRFSFYALKTLFESVGKEFPLGRRDLPKVEEPRRPYFTVEEIRKILRATKEHGTTRDYAIIRLSALLGSRRIELHLLNRDDIDLEQSRIVIRTRKRGKTRVRSLDPETIEAIRDYLKTRKDVNEALFISERGERISLRELSWVLNKYAKMAEVRKEKIGYHCFRRGLTTALYKRGVKTRELMDLLGWRTPLMPLIYIQLEPLEVEEKVKKIHPILEEE